MAADQSRFRRKLSAEEARESYIMILKRDLDFFPKVGKPFKLNVGSKDFDTHIQSIECWCQGPKKPHSHYRIDTKPFRDLVDFHWGTKITIEKKDENKYHLLT